MFPAPPRPGNDDHADPAAFWFARLNGGGPTSAEDEAGPDGAADGDHLDLARLESLVIAEVFLGKNLSFGGHLFHGLH